ncbi:MAG: Rz1-like lysis system protein LysC [Burkholderia gladioli]
MKAPKIAHGLILSCLLTLPACKQAPLLPAPVITFNACQTVTPCRLSAMAPVTNGDLNDALTETRGAWARCAATVDMIAACQAKFDAAAAAPGASVPESAP